MMNRPRPWSALGSGLRCGSKLAVSKPRPRSLTCGHQALGLEGQRDLDVVAGAAVADGVGAGLLDAEHDVVDRPRGRRSTGAGSRAGARGRAAGGRAAGGRGSAGAVARSAALRCFATTGSPHDVARGPGCPHSTVAVQGVSPLPGGGADRGVVALGDGGAAAAIAGSRPRAAREEDVRFDRLTATIGPGRGRGVIGDRPRVAGTAVPPGRRHPVAQLPLHAGSHWRLVAARDVPAQGPRAPRRRAGGALCLRRRACWPTRHRRRGPSPPRRRPGSPTASPSAPRRQSATRPDRPRALPRRRRGAGSRRRVQVGGRSGKSEQDESIKKDMAKVLAEQPPALWFHVVRDASDATLQGLAARTGRGDLTAEQPLQAESLPGARQDSRAARQDDRLSRLRAEPRRDPVGPSRARLLPGKPKDEFFTIETAVTDASAVATALEAPSRGLRQGRSRARPAAAL